MVMYTSKVANRSVQGWRPAWSSAIRSNRIIRPMIFRLAPRRGFQRPHWNLHSGTQKGFRPARDSFQRFKSSRIFNSKILRHVLATAGAGFFFHFVYEFLLLAHAASDIISRCKTVIDWLKSTIGWCKRAEGTGFTGGIVEWLKGRKERVKGWLQRSEENIFARFKRGKRQDVEKARKPGEVIKVLRQVATYYGTGNPLLSCYTGLLLDHLEAIHQVRADELDCILDRMWRGCRQAFKHKGSLEESFEMAENVRKSSVRELGALARGSASEICEKNSKLKRRLDAGLDLLTFLCDEKESSPVGRAIFKVLWEAVHDIIHENSNAEVDEVHKSIIDYVQVFDRHAQNVHEEFIQNFLAREQPLRGFFRQHPKSRKLLEKNLDKLRWTDPYQLRAIMLDVAESGDEDKLERYVRAVQEVAASAEREIGIGNGKPTLLFRKRNGS